MHHTCVFINENSACLSQSTNMLENVVERIWRIKKFVGFFYFLVFNIILSYRVSQNRQSFHFVSKSIFWKHESVIILRSKPVSHTSKKFWKSFKKANIFVELLWRFLESDGTFPKFSFYLLVNTGNDFSNGHRILAEKAQIYKYI